MEKSSDAFRTISEVADDLDLPQHVLRFWETRFPHIRPLKRAGGRRYYRPADVVLLRTIRQLLYDQGYTIKGVQRLLKEQGARGLRAGGAPGPAGLAGLESDAAAVEEDSDDIENLPIPVALHAPRTPSVDRKALGDVLATLDECTRILESLRGPRA